MATRLEMELKTGAMLSKKGADIRSAFKQQTEELYRGENIAKDYMEACAKWDVTIATYCNVDIMLYLHMLIEEAFRRKINLDRCSKWRMLMRSILPPELMKKMSGLTQIPQMSMIDKTEFTRRDDEIPRAFFRRN